MSTQTHSTSCYYFSSIQIQQYSTLSRQSWLTIHQDILKLLWPDMPRYVLQTLKHLTKKIQLAPSTFLLNSGMLRRRISKDTNLLYPKSIQYIWSIGLLLALYSVQSIEVHITVYAKFLPYLCNATFLTLFKWRKWKLIIISICCARLYSHKTTSPSIHLNVGSVSRLQWWGLRDKMLEKKQQLATKSWKRINFWRNATQCRMTSE